MSICHNFVHILVPICMAGEEWNGTDCLKCQIDQYKSSIGNNMSCETCPQNETAPEEGYSKCGTKLVLVPICGKFVINLFA